MNGTWILVDAAHEAPAALGALGAAGDDACALVVGDEALAAATAQQVAHVLHLSTGGAPAEALAVRAAAVLAAQSPAPALIVAGQTPAGRALLGAAASVLGASVLSDVVAVRDAAAGGGPASVEVDQLDLEGRVTATSTVTGPAALLVRPADIEVATVSGRVTPAEEPAGAAPAAIARVSLAPAPGASGGVVGAERVVSVGRGIGTREALADVEVLAQALGAEIGCSMPVAEDWGWVPRDHYIGRSGQQVSPRLYLALGISGAPQHLEGIRGARTVVAVNNDPEAPIFQAADYGIVADLHEVVPALIQALA